MNIIEAQELARTLMATHQLQEWTFEFDNARKRFGCTRHFSKTISLSKPLTLLNDEYHVKDTILHEIAHALSPVYAGHGYTWVTMARKVGANPQRFYDSREVTIPAAPYTATCSNCGHTSKRFKKVRPGRKIACGYCCKTYNYGRFTEKFLLNFVKGVK